MKIGDKVVRTPETFAFETSGNKSVKTAQEGTVIFVHPKGRYHTVEFDLNGTKVRESFFGLRGY